MGPISADIDLGHNQVMSGAALVTNEASHKYDNFVVVLQASGSGTGTRSKIIFDQSKKQLFNIHSGFRQVHRRLKNAWRVETLVVPQRFFLFLLFRNKLCEYSLIFLFLVLSSCQQSQMSFQLFSLNLFL
uniref:Uncharacterized protein n=1 Tax=Ascaris lumbricoides TaxID=6252 RepID=A0A0M3IQ26_ASCLU